MLGASIAGKKRSEDQLRGIIWAIARRSYEKFSPELREVTAPQVRRKRIHSSARRRSLSQLTAGLDQARIVR